MADQAPPEDVQNSNTGSSAGDGPSSAGETPTFPNRLRVHALAKLLGVTSKQVLAKLGELGIEARSAQSSLGRDDAETVHTAFSAAGVGAPITEFATPEVATPEVATPEAVAPEAVAPEAVAPEAVAPEVTEPDAVESVPDLPKTTGSLFSTTESVPHTRSDADDASTVRPTIATPVFLQPEAPAEPPRARRRSRKAAGPAADAAGSEDATGAQESNTYGLRETTADAEKTGDADEPKTSPAPAATASTSTESIPSADGRDSDSTDAGADTDESSSPRSDDDDDQSQPRRRRRGRRGRGRGRGDQSSDGSSDENDDSDQSVDDESVDNALVDNALVDNASADAEPADAESGNDSDSGDDSDSTDDKPTGERRSRRRSRSRGGSKSTDATSTDATSADVTSTDVTDTDAPSTTGPNSGQAESASIDDETPDSGAEASADDSDDDEDGTDGSSRRRRRRRRRRSSGEATSEAASSEDDPPNTVVHEREPRNKARGNKDEVQGITGSTRLEAKRQRRRDGRDAGRRRPPILTESEFLARRESVDRVMVVREKSFPDQGETTQVAVLEDGVLVEHFVTSSASASMVGNVYLGRVQNVLPSMEAAFIDIGRGRNGVLYAGEVNWDAAGLGGNSRKIEQALKPGDQVLVQVSKDPVGHKGARLTTQLSLAGRYLVYVPGGSSTGISRKLPDTERKRLKEILRDIVPAEAGVIIRTAAEGVSEEELARDVTRLQAQWATIEEASAKAETGKGSQPQTLYEEPDLLVKVIRDLFNEDFVKLVIEGEKAWTTTSNYIETVAADMLPKLERHVAEPGKPDVFEAHRIDEQLTKALDRKVWLPSGGTLVIDRTEAMTVVDVNTGKFTGSGGNLEETVTRNNLEAAEEVVRQMRLRDIGGMIVVDFIDMVLESNRDLVLRRLTEALGRDRTRHQVSEVTSLGLVQMTRKKLGTGLVEAFSTTCEHCQGRGIVVHPFPVESKPDDGSRSNSTRSDSGSQRKRRGRDKPESNGGTAASEQHEHPVDPSIKRAHPVALAMAAHHDEVVDDVTPADVTDNAATSDDSQIIDAADVANAVDTANVEAEEAGVPAEPTGGQRRSRSGRRKASRPTASTTVEPAQDSVDTGETADIVATDTAEPVAPQSESVEPETVHGERTAEEPAAQDVTAGEPAAVAEPEVASEPVVKTRRPRRVARKAAAPTAETPDAAAVFVIPATSDGVAEADSETPAPVTTPAFAQADGAEADVEAPVSKPRRRRAAARPAGPPVDA